jgi:hypothetical protein
MMIGPISLLCVIFGAAQVEPILLPAGETRLTDIGLCRVGYVYSDGRSGLMGLGWTGHFHGPTGISYTPFGRQDGKDCLLIHCPWRGGTGITYAEYPLQLPAVKPMRLELAIAMKADVARPDRSDGSQFRVSIRPDGGPQQMLVDEHYALAKWRPFAFDLSPHAGKRVLLRLEVGPGPKNDASWDYAFFGDPKIVVGDGKPAAVAVSIWPASTDLKRLANRQDLGCCPTGPAAGGARLNWNEASRHGDFQIDWPTDRGRIGYTVATRRDGVSPATGLIDVAAVISAGGGAVGTYHLGAGSGVVLTDGKKTWEPDDPEARIELVGVRQAGELLQVETKHTVGAVVARVVTEFGVRASSLAVTVRSNDPVISEVRFGSIAAPLRRSIVVPYLGLGPVWYLPDAQLFGSIVLDWTRSAASHHDGARASYSARTDGTRSPASTTAYYTLSPRIDEVFCNIPHPPSPFMDDLAGRIMFDVWGGKFRDDAEWFTELATYGVRDAAIIKHVWQRSGYDNALPNHYPANPGLGGDPDMIAYVETTRDLGYRTSLHENYVDFYPNSELYDANDVALEADGKPMKAWFNGGTGIQSFAVKPTAIMKYARMQSPEIHRRYGTNAAYLDVHTCVPPWFHVDHRAGEAGAATFAAVFKAHAELFAFERRTHEGPLFGEGNHQFYWAGLCDGCEAQVDGGENAPWLLDFDLLKVHPRMVNHGMGYLERWLASGYGAGWHANVPSTLDLDKYRAMELAFGHAGFVAQQVWHHLPYVLREYYLVTPIQQRYVTAKPRTILYDVGGKLLPASAALAAGPLSNHVYVEYDSGLKLWCNGSDGDWVLPTGALCGYGFRAEAEGLLATTNYFPTPDGTKLVADYREADEVIYADARAFEPKAPVSLVDVAPGVSAFETTGPRQFKVTYRWQVKEDQAKDRHCFVHFCSQGAGNEEQISFQNDHPLSPPSGQWKAGQTITDGPHTVTIPAGLPDGEYKLLIGLFDDSGRAMLPFESDGHQRYAIGTVTLKGAQVSFAQRKLEPLATDAWRERMAQHTNPKRAMVDFGKVVTNGCVIVRPMHKSWYITIYPREQPFNIRLRMKRLDPNAAGGGWTVQMINVNKRSFGQVPVKVFDDGNTMEWETGQKGMYYYCVSK